MLIYMFSVSVLNKKERWVIQQSNSRKNLFFLLSYNNSKSDFGSFTEIQKSVDIISSQQPSV